MINVETSIKSGNSSLKQKISGLTGELGYAETAYHLPVTYALTGKVVRNADDARSAYELTGENPFVACECYTASVNTKIGGEPAPYTGFLPDADLRKMGYSLVDGSILGLALVAGSPPNADVVAGICRELQEKYMLTFLAGGVVETLAGSGIKVGAEYRLVPLGSVPLRGIHFVDIIARVAMMFGGVSPGDPDRLINYARQRAKAIVIVFPGLNDEEVAFIDALSILGIPILSMGGYEAGRWLDTNPEKAVQRGMDLKGIKVTVTAIPIPMGCSPAFEGKSIRKEEMYVESGGGRSPAFELLRMRPAKDVTDGKVTVIGPDIEDIPEGSAIPLGIIVEVAGTSMKKEYEPVLERRIHNFVNYGEGSWHVAQRDLVWFRLSKEAVSKGVRLKHIGTLIAAKFRIDFPNLLDAVSVTLITDEQNVNSALLEAQEIYRERDQRIKDLRDSDVDLFYSCTLCQTFAPNHVCIITPERPALCGAITWLDGKTAYEISPSGANQPVPKGEAVDARTGEFEGVNRFVKKASHGEVERCCLYSIMENPMTACGCFECIAVMLPETNGFMIVSREFKGMTPSGMTFSTLAGTIGGGAQTPGFAGISKNFILSDRFLQAEGGIKRLVWMPAHLKEELKERLLKKISASGVQGFYDQIADESISTTIEELTEFLEKVRHPALEMPSLI